MAQNGNNTDQAKITRNTSFLLAFVAGFCDTVTFVAAGELFSAHVTGNFIVFAYNIIKAPDPDAWRKLIAFPVFVLAAMIGGRITRKVPNMYILLTLEGALLLFSGLIALTLKDFNDPHQWQVFIIAMIIVVALGFQNTFGNIFGKATYGLTTTMTGNVTRASIDFIKFASTGLFNAEGWEHLKKPLVLISGFLIGCLLGAFLAAEIGLSAVILPGMLLLAAVLKRQRETSKT